MFTVRPDRYLRLRARRLSVPGDGYSFQGFDTRRCIFVHIPKAAGVSINRTLFGNLGGGHRSMRDYQLIFSRRDFERYFKFTFVRNPWDRLLSAYNFLKRGGMTKDDRLWAEANLAAYDDFEQFVTGWVTRSNLSLYVHFKPQVDFLRTPHSDRLPIDFLGFYENLSADFRYVCRRLGLPGNIELTQENRTAVGAGAPDYRSRYTDEMREIVAEAYREDIVTFGYAFDDSSPDALLARCPDGHMARWDD
ncbi:MAG TPA: sulfotransferase family protein [Gammaproteobacteria bacterium]|nr:sulfotransferase family protein [Gammaproteobacteria bacterium]